MKKRILALVCALTLFAGIAPAAAALSGEQTRAADTLYTLGVVQGTGGDSGYALSATATRAQAIAVVVRLAGCASEAARGGYAAVFTDLPIWAKDSVALAYAKGWVSGTSGTTFSPNAVVSANAYCAFLLRMLGYSDEARDFTVSGAARFAQHIGLTSQDYTAGTFTRGDLFAVTADALSFCYKDTQETVAERLVNRGIVSRAAANALGLLTPELSARQIADRSTAAVFQLDSYQDQLHIDAQIPSSNSSGFFISADGIALTNYHAITGSIRSTVTLSTGETYPVERVIYYDEGIDIAVIRVGKTALSGEKTSFFAHLELVGTTDLRAGDTVYAIGNPLGLGLAVSSGVISTASRVVERYTLPCIMNTADISQGSSGGALLNTYGQVIGITSGAYTYGNNMYLAVPVNPAMEADLTAEGWTLAEVAAIQARADAANAGEV